MEPSDLPARPNSPRFLVTAGNTRERIDEVRDWGNIFTGATGLAIARALAPIGAVDLLTSNAVHLQELAGAAPTSGIRASAYASHQDLKAQLAQRLSAQPYAGVFMAAAVSDYRPAGVFELLSRADSGGGSATETWTVRSVQAGKVKGNYPSIAIVGSPTEKLVDLFRGPWNHRGLLVKFKLEVGLGAPALLEIAEKSRRASGADYVVANTLDMVRGPKPGAYLVSAAGAEWLPRQRLPERLAEVARLAVAAGG